MRCVLKSRIFKPAAVSDITVWRLSFASVVRFTSFFILLALGFTMTFASIDWAMSLEPDWYSTSYGLLWIAGHALAAMALAVPLAGLFGELPPRRAHGD